MKSVSAARYDTPWRRLPWTGTLAILFWSCALWGFSAFVTKAPHIPDRILPIDARFLESPLEPDQPAPPAQTSPPVRPAPSPKQQVRPARPVATAPTTAEPLENSVSDTPQLQPAPAPAQNHPQDRAATPNQLLSAARHPGATVRAERVGVIASPPDLSIHNEETELNPDGMGVRAGGWQQPYNEVCDIMAPWDRSCGLEYFSQPPAPWCHDANPFLPWETGTCENELNQAIDAYKHKDYATAIARFEKLAVKDYAPAQSNLGAMYAEGKGVEKDDQQAVYWWRKAAAEGDAKAVFNLALMYSDGRGVTRNDQQAAYWNRKAAYYGYAVAQYNLGVMYALGTGVSKNDKQAVYWYRIAANSGNALAQYNLGVMYANGTGVPKDDEKAVYWYRKAANRGNANAQYTLGAMYAEGAGVAKDEEQAYFWWLLSSAQGNQSAEKSRDAIEMRLSLQQQANARAGTHAWKPK